MTRRNRIFRLEAGAHDGVIHFLSCRVDARSLAEGGRRSMVTITRTGSFTDPRYGRFDITRKMLQSMIRNFNARVYGQDIALDVAHEPEHGAAGYFRKLVLDGNKLRGEVEWTEFGIEAVTQRGFRYLSAEYHENWRDNEAGKAHGPTLLAAALTIRPVIKGLDPVQLSEASTGDTPTLISRQLQDQFIQEHTAMKDKFLKLLAQALAKIGGLPEAAITQLSETFGTVLDTVDDEDTAQGLLEAFTASGKQLAESLPTGADGQTIRLDFSGLKLPAAGGGGMTAEAVKKLLAEQQAAEEAERKRLAEAREQNVTLFGRLLEEAKGLESLPEDARKQLAAAGDLITPEMTEEQVRALAEHQIKLGSQMAVQSQLASMGYAAGPAGNVRISVDESNHIRSLQETVDKRIGLADLPDSRRYSATGGQLPEENKALAEKVLAQFDRDRAPDLQAEHRQLAGGDGNVSDVAVPVVWERTVIREALYRLVGLQFVDSGTEAFATSYSIPYSYRDPAAAGIASTRRYEGQSVSRAGVIQTAETAYNIPQKLAFEVSDELRYLTQARHLNWDAVAENQRNASRIIGEDLEQLIFNEVVQAADEYGAVAVGNEDLGPQTDGTVNVVQLAHFPVVRPRSVFDLQGNQVGVTSNPITVNYNGAPISEYDGTGTQPAGTYYVLDYNLGEIHLVNQAGAIVTPGAAVAFTVSYSYASNVYAFDTDPGTTPVDDHWDQFLYRYGLRKSVIEDERYHQANFGIMSGTVMTQIEQAKQFGANSRRNGTDLAADGNLGRVKDVPNFKTAAPGLWMGDQRVVIGERGQTRLRMTKPWALGDLENQRDVNGRFTGKKEAYGDQFVVLHTPTQLKRAYTSVVLYSASARIPRVTP